MTLIQLAVSLVAIGVVLWLINSYVPMQNSIKKILNIVVVIAVVLYVLAAFGIFGPSPGMRILR